MAERMSALDAVSGSLAECFITIDGNRYNFMQLTSFESTYSMNIGEVPILGQVNKGHKPSGGSGEWSGTMHYNTSVMREIMLKYQNKGVFQYFDIQVTNEDPTSSVGSQTVILRDCLISGGSIAKFDTEADYLTEEISGTFERFEMPEKFSALDGM